MTREELERQIAYFQDKLKALKDASTVENYDKIKFRIDGTELIKYSGNDSTVKIPYGVTGIAEEAFKDCKNLKNVILPDSITHMAWSAFKGCDSLRFNVYDNVEYLGTDDNPYFALYDASNLDDIDRPRKTCKIHPDTRLIGNKAFYECEELRKIDIPDGVLYISEEAISWCDKLTEVIIPDSVIEIFDAAFSLNDKLRRVFIPYKMYSVGDKTYCRVERVGHSVFCGCPKLTVYCEAEEKPDEWADGWDDDLDDGEFGEKIKVVWGCKK